MQTSLALEDGRALDSHKNAAAAAAAAAATTAAGGRDGADAGGYAGQLSIGEKSTPRTFVLILTNNIVPLTSAPEPCRTYLTRASDTILSGPPPPPGR